MIVPTGMAFSASITNLYVSSEVGPHTQPHYDTSSGLCSDKQESLPYLRFVLCVDTVKAVWLFKEPADRRCVYYKTFQLG
jgi:hypothetical protein